MRPRLPVLLATVALALCASVATTDSGVAAPGCDARPVVEEFLAALSAGDVARVDQVFAREGEGWNWYSISDRAGQRLIPASHGRDSLARYFAGRIAQHESLRLIRIDENGEGNFGILLVRRADDLRGGEPVKREGKGWVSCSTGKIGVWSLGGAPPPKSFGPCPRGALPYARRDLAGARTAVLKFVRDTFSEMNPALDTDGARVTQVGPAGSHAKGRARIQCGRVIQSRTVVLQVRLPRVHSSEWMASVAFYASRTRTGWLIWSLGA